MSSCSSRSLSMQPKSGIYLHQTVPMDSWCVTREDLLQLQSAVREAVDKGEIVPTTLDEFDVHDLRFGPSVYTVVSQLIKPVTDVAGGHSWALMKHPKGLKCDIFVTHAWAEGIYEFIGKLLNSWPAGANHAYCCMLSNPQNLDIADLINQPSSSPFARALKSATYMIVIPNRKASIYSRMWCVYEAYLAYKWKKVIYVASFPVPNLRSRCAAYALLFGVTMAADLIVEDPCSDYSVVRTRLHKLNGVVGVVTVFALLMPPCFALDLINAIGVVIEGILLGTILRNITILSVSGRVLFMSLTDMVEDTFFFFGSVADRARFAEAAVEKECLQNGFTGKVCNAECSMEEDRKRILDEIRATNDEINVDHAISVLLRMGMYTKSIRKAIANGVIPEEAGHFRLAVLVAGFVNWGPRAVFILSFEQNTTPIGRILEVALAIGAVLWLLIYLNSPRDERAFAANALFKFVWMLPQVAYYSVLILMYLGFIPEEPSDTFSFYGYIDYERHVVRVCGGGLALVCSAFGLGWVTTIPLVGPRLAKIVLWQGKCFCRRRPGQREQAESAIELKLIGSRSSQDNVFETDDKHNNRDMHS